MACMRRVVFSECIHVLLAARGPGQTSLRVGRADAVWRPIAVCCGVVMRCTPQARNTWHCGSTHSSCAVRCSVSALHAPHVPHVPWQGLPRLQQRILLVGLSLHDLLDVALGPRESSLLFFILEAQVVRAQSRTKSAVSRFTYQFGCKHYRVAFDHVDAERDIAILPTGYMPLQSMFQYHISCEQFEFMGSVCK